MTINTLQCDAIGVPCAMQEFYYNDISGYFTGTSLLGKKIAVHKSVLMPDLGIQFTTESPRQHYLKAKAKMEEQLTKHWKYLHENVGQHHIVEKL